MLLCMPRLPFPPCPACPHLTQRWQLGTIERLPAGRHSILLLPWSVLGRLQDAVSRRLPARLASEGYGSKARVMAVLNTLAFRLLFCCAAAVSARARAIHSGAALTPGSNTARAVPVRCFGARASCTCHLLGLAIWLIRIWRGPHHTGLNKVASLTGRWHRRWHKPASRAGQRQGGGNRRCRVGPPVQHRVWMGTAHHRKGARHHGTPAQLIRGTACQQLGGGKAAR